MSCTRYIASDGRPRFSWVDSSGKRAPFSCRTWSCDDCRPRLVSFLRWRVGNWAESLDLSRFWTFTLDPADLTPEALERWVKLRPRECGEVDALYTALLREHGPDKAEQEAAELAYFLRVRAARAIIRQGNRRASRGDLDAPAVVALRHLYARYLRSTWNKFLTVLRRSYPSLSFVSVMELHADNLRPHLHALVSDYIPWAWAQERWQAVGGGSHVYVEHVEDARRISAYVAKYITKTGELPARYWPRGVRHVSTSRGIHLDLTPAQWRAWEAAPEPEEDHVRCVYGSPPWQEERARCRACAFRRRCGWRDPDGWHLERDGSPIARPPGAEIDELRNWWKRVRWRIRNRAVREARYSAYSCFGNDALMTGYYEVDTLPEGWQADREAIDPATGEIIREA